MWFWLHDCSGTDNIKSVYSIKTLRPGIIWIAGAYGFEHHTASNEYFPSDITSAAE